MQTSRPSHAKPRRSHARQHASAFFAAVLALDAGAATDEPVFYDGFETPTQTQACAPDPLIQPEGWIRHDRTWESNWSSPDGNPVATYPNSVGFPVPIGAAVQGYRVVAFVPNPEQTVTIYWEPVQGNLAQGYFPPRPGNGAWISLSPCPGDLRAADDASADPFLRSGCRRGGSATQLLFSTLEFESDFQSCHLDAGETYYMTIVMANPQDGLDAQETTCPDEPNTQSRCDVQATHRAQ